jgi:hypothetical protein
MLLLNFINDNSLRSCLLDRSEKNIGGNRDKKQSIKKDEDDKKSVDPYVNPNSHKLVIRISIKCG